MRTFLTLAILPLAACVTLDTAPRGPDTPPRILLDADTANELDDLYAVAQVVADPHVVLGSLTSSHFNNTEIGTKGRWHAKGPLACL